MAAGALAAALGCAGARPSGAGPDATGVPVAWTGAACAAAGADADRDGLDDGCELALARAFAPVLRVDRRDCLWHPTTGRLAGGYLFAAQPVPGGAPGRVSGGVRLAYLPAYLRDCGWTGAVCRLRAPGCGAHAGDSELVLVDVAPAGAGRWATTRILLSAHCFGRAGGRCRWYRGADLDAFKWADGRPRGAPEVWVARGKHAHYPSRGRCETGHWGWDGCARDAEPARFPVGTAAQNVGSRARPASGPGGCLAAERLPLGAEGADAGTGECVWDDARPFRGWQRTPAGVAPTAYGRVLRALGEF